MSLGSPAQSKLTSSSTGLIATRAVLARQDKLLNALLRAAWTLVAVFLFQSAKSILTVRRSYIRHNDNRLSIVSVDAVNLVVRIFE